jgi:hypothetical protein
MRTVAGIILFIALTLSLRAEEKKPSVTCFDKTAGGAAILDDKAEPYFDTLQPTEMSTKTDAPITGNTLAEQRAECRKRYKDSVLDFSDEEKAMLNWAVEKIMPAVQENYPLYAQIPWSFIKVANSIEGGFPHTRGGSIVISQTVLTRFGLMKSKLPEAKSIVGIASLLLHEQSHVFQRQNAQLMGKLYTDVWGFKRADKIESCEWLELRHLANPDGLDTGWIFPIADGDKTRYIWPLVIFDSPDKPQRMGADFREIGLELQKTDKGFGVVVSADKVPAYKPLAEIPDYVTKFGNWEESFHPNEIAAEMFSRIVCIDSLLPKDKLSPERMEAMEKEIGPVRKWFREHLK